MRIVAYTYEADVHCPACTYRRFGPSPEWNTPGPGLTDVNGIPKGVLDREGNPVHPVFMTDEHDLNHCGTCREEI